MRALRDGLTAGLVLAAAETVASVATGRDLPTRYLVLVAAFDLGSGLLAAGMASLVRRVAGWRGEDYASGFVPLAAAVVVVYAADKVVMAAVARAEPIAVAVALLLTTFVILVVAGVRISRLARTRQPESSSLVSIVLIIAFLAAGTHVARSIAHGRSGLALLTPALLLLALAGGIVIQDRFLSHHALPKKRMTRAVAAAAIGALAVTLGLARARASRESAVQAQAADRLFGRRNVLLISIDTLRADRLSLYGYARDTTPNLRRLARESEVFTHAVSPGTWTLPGHAAMLTGRFPGGLGALALGGALPAEAVTLAERLSAAGYRTGAVVANASSLNRRLGWAQGFGFYSEEPRWSFGYRPSLNTALLSFPLGYGRFVAPWKPADEINRTALSWLVADDRAPFFLFINYMDTHDPYVPPDHWVDRYPGRLSFLVDPVPAVLRGQRDLSPAEAGHYRALYDGAVAYVDDQIGRLLAQLEARGRLDDTLVIVTSDHGEFFGEHRLLRHEIGPYEPVHRVPLLIRYPGGARSGIEHGWVELVDIVPTVLANLGLPPPEGLDGEVLPDVRHPILVQQAPHPSSGRLHGRGLERGYTGLYDGSRKLVVFDDGTILLFDLGRDADEAHDLAAAGEDPKLMRARLAEANARYPRRDSPPLPDAEAQERLRAGGYLR